MNHARLREIARAATGHWGYDPQRVADWAAAIEFPPEEQLIVADRSIEPRAMGRGLGRLGAVYVRDSEPSEWGRVSAVMAVSLVE